MALLGRIKILSRESLIYGIGGAASNILTFLFLPLYTKFLTPEDFGYLTIFTVFQSVIEITAVFGLSSGLFRYYLMAKDKAEQQTVMNTYFWTQIGFIIILSVIAFPLSNWFSVIVFGTSKFSQIFIMVMATGILSALGGFIFSFMRAERKPLFFALVQVVKVALLALVNVYLVAILRKNYTGIIMGNLIVFLVITLIVLVWFSRYIGFSFSIAHFKKLIVFVSPIYLVNVFFFLLNLSDRFFLNHYLSTTEVGIYSFGNKIGSVVMIGVITPFSTAVIPYALSIAKEDYFKITYAKIMKYFLLTLLYLSLGFFYFSREIILAVSNPSYADANGIVGPILLSSIFYGLYYNLSIGLDIVEKTYLATVVVVVGAIVSIGLNYVTIPWFGMYGSALASCISNAVLFIFMYYFCQRNYKIDYEVNAFRKLVGIVTVYCLCFYAMPFLSLPFLLNIIIKLFLCAAFPLFLFIFGVFDRKERQYCKNKIKQFKSKFV